MEESATKRKCPRCGNSTLRTFYSDHSDLKLGGACTLCGYKGYFVGEELVAIPTT